MIGRVSLSTLSGLLALVLLACVSAGGSERAPFDAPAPSTTPAPAPQPSQIASPPTGSKPVPGRVSLNAVGDLMLARDIIDLMDAHGSVYPFAFVRSLLAEADITIANMEGAFTDRGLQAQKFYTFRTPPRHARGLAEAGIDVVALGNNHAMDFGPQGLADTLAALDDAGIRHSGAGQTLTDARTPAVIEANGLRLAFLSYNAVLEATFAGPSSPGVARALRSFLQSDIPEAKQRADVVVVSLHFGAEYTDAPTEEQRDLARAAIDAGATLVLGSHPHVLQGWERYKGGLIVYSLGNFVFDLDYDDLATLGPRPFQTIVLHVQLDRSGVLEATYTPVFIDPAENRPLPATPDQARLIDARLEYLHSLVR